MTNMRSELQPLSESGDGETTKPLKYWVIPVTIVEHRREALVIAETKTKAIAKCLDALWEELGDAKKFDIRKVGAAVCIGDAE